MADYKNLGSLADDVAKAAIRSEMMGLGCYEDGDHYVYDEPGYPRTVMDGPDGPPTGPVSIEGEPQPFGTSPTTVYLNPTDDVYEPWKRRVAEAFNGWDQLPDPAPLKSAADDAESACRQLAVTTVAGKGAAGQANKDLAGLISTVQTELAQYNAATIDAFSRQYVSQLAAVCSNQSLAAGVLAVGYRAEEQLWASARLQIADIAEKARLAMHPPQQNADFAFAILGIAAGVAGLFLSGGTVAAALVSQTSTVLGVLDTLKGVTTRPDTRHFAAPNPHECLTHVVDAIHQLSRDIATEEDANAQAMSNAWTMLFGADSDFLLPRPDYLYDEDDPTQLVTAREELYLSPEHLSGIGTRDMPAIATALRTAANDVDQNPGLGAFSRPAGIGRYYAGPGEDLELFASRLVEVMRQTGQQLVDAGEILDIAARSFTQADDQVAQALRDHQETVNAAEPGHPRRTGPGREYE